eukprot:9694403-Ditylum_brightwellii.AAC.1
MRPPTSQNTSKRTTPTKHCANSRLFRDLSDLKRHTPSVNTGVNMARHAGAECFFDYHNDMFFGIVQEDTQLKDKKKSKWNYPSQSKGLLFTDLKNGATERSSIFFLF